MGLHPPVTGTLTRSAASPTQIEEPIHVLCVDDEPDIVELAATMLQRQLEDVSVVTETDARAAMERIDDPSDHIDCVVSDYDMPDIDGLELLQAVRQQEPDLPFILFTGRGSEDIASEAIAAGVTDYLQKGTGTDQYEVLANRIENAVGHYRAAQRADRQTRILDIVREVSQEVVQARTREEIEQQVCSCFADSDPYRLAWIGEPDPETDELVPRAWSGIDDEDLDHIIVRTDDTPRGQSPGGEAVRTREGQVVQDINAEASVDPWPKIADEYGSEAVIALPLDHEETFYGVLVIYAEQANAFDETEQEILEELCDTITAGIHAAETRQRLAEREQDLTRSERRFQAVFNNPGTFIGVLEPDGTLSRANETALEFIDAAPGDVVGDPFWETPWWTHSEQLQQQLQQWIERAAAGEFVRFEADHHAPDGDRVTIDGKLCPVTDDGEVTGLIASGRDITNRRERQQKLAAIKERYQKLFEYSNDTIMVVDPANDTITDVNKQACETFGYSRDEFRSISPGAIHPDYMDDTRDEFVEGVYEEGHGWTDELTCVTKGGNEIPMEISAAVLEFDDSTQMVASMRDISERVANRQKLERQVDQLDEFTAVVSHDLRNPLRAAQGQLDLFRDTGDEVHLDKLDQAHDRMEDLIDNLLELAQQGQMVSDPEPVGIRDVVTDAWAQVDPEGADADLQVDISDGRTVDADPVRFQQLFENLFRNAIEHTDPGVTITVGEFEPDHASDLKQGIYVEDDGPGPSADDLDTVFESGYSTSEEGTGLGLAIVEQIVEAHGWEITATESATGGARFEIIS